MKKRWMLLIAALVLVLAACSNEIEKKEPKDVQEKDNHIEKKSKEENVEEDDLEDNPEDDPETEIEKKESDEEEAEANESVAETEDEGQSDEEVEEKKDEDKEETLTDYEFADLGYAIFEAQAKKDYDYIESVLSKGSTLQKDSNTIQFDNVTYPHTYELISEKDFANLDDRYFHPGDSVIVGFVVTDYENESSYIIDVQFIKEDGKWKLNDMDINK